MFIMTSNIRFFFFFSANINEQITVTISHEHPSILRSFVVSRERSITSRRKEKPQRAPRVKRDPLLWTDGQEKSRLFESIYSYVKSPFWRFLNVEEESCGGIVLVLVLL